MPESHVPYQDGAESDLLRIVSEVDDRSTGSDELAERSFDWPTRYHLSRLRANVLRPLEIAPSTRVLDVGAGTGVLSRYLAELGAEVVALEGNPDRAEVARARCAGLDGVSVVATSIEGFDDEGDGFDLVLSIGVLEYAADPVGGDMGQAEFVERLGGLLRDDGALVVAIENQLGLKYLLGHGEDHLGLPWVGVEGYPGASGIRTLHRRGLAALLGGAGFSEQRWLYPFPDYKLPRVTLAARAYEGPDAVELVDQLVANPSSDAGIRLALLCDHRAAHRTFVEAGLGPEVANSFVVVAGRSEAAASRWLSDDVVAWQFGDERRRRWMRTRTVRATAAGRVVEARPLDPGEQVDGWLRQHVPERMPYAVGPTLEQLVRDALARGDEGAAKEAFDVWRGYLRGREEPREPGHPAHPFLREGTTAVLPADHLDSSFPNFVVTADGLAYVDAEWVAEGGVDPDVAAVRALWYFAYHLVTTGAPHPFGPTVTIDELTVALGDLAGVDVTTDLLAAWREAEAQLQELVSGADREDDLRTRVEHGGQRATDPGMAATMPLARLAGAVEELHRAQVDNEKLRRLVGELTEQAEHWRREAGLTRHEVNAAHVRAEAAEREVERWRARWERIENLWPVRAARWVARRPYEG